MTHTRLKLFTALLLSGICCFHSVNSFHEGTGEDDAIYLQHANKEPHPDSEVVQDIDVSKPTDDLDSYPIVGTGDEFQPGTTQDAEVHVTIPTSKTPSTSSTTQASTIKTTSNPKTKTTAKPVSKSSEQQLSRQEKSTQAVTESTKKPITSSSNQGKTTTVPPSTAASSASAGTSSPQISESTTESTAVTVTVSILTTSTAVPPTEKPKIPSNNLYCLCDLHRHSCDMNCCCDIDCSDDERSLFSGCEDGAGIHDKRSVARRQRSCYQSFVFYKHFETLNLQRTDSGLLCILRDNNREDNELSSSNIKELRDDIVSGKINIRNKYEWGKGDQFNYRLQPYQFGSPILGTKASASSKDLENKLLAFVLPASYHETLCTINEPVRFLENVHSRCRIKLENLARDCEKMGNLDGNSIIENLQILGNPGDADQQLMTITRSKQCNGGLCTPEADDIETLEFSRPTLNEEKWVCQDVLMSLEFTVFHEGIDGITEIVAKAQLQDVPLNSTQIFQEYRVNFIWSREDNNTNSTKDLEDWPRSGNPGYIVGKPVILGEKVKVLESLKNETKPNPTTVENNGQETAEEEKILVWNDPARWMTILSPGICSKLSDNKGHRRSVAFDYGHCSTCTLNITRFKYCEDLQIEVAKILLGSEDPISFEKRAWHVAAYGNSNPSDISEWVPVTFSFPTFSTSKGSSKSLISKGCEGIVSALHISIAYAFVGSVDFPQARIAGVLYELGDSIPVPVVPSDACTQKNCQSHNKLSQISVSTTVTFKDVTTPPVTRVAKWPVVSIRLPADFFYPFSSPSSASDKRMLISPVIIMILTSVVFAIIV